MEMISHHSSGRRKLVYISIMIALLAVTIVARGVVAMPSGVKDTAGHWSIQQQSERLELSEMSQGDVELSGAAVRLLLTGSRGIVVCGLWISAQEKQKRQEWNELDLTVKSVLKLQPHFIIPWLFQSWNLAYNVSVQMDNLNDMYYYIARGIGLLAEGESINRNSPDMRYEIAFYYQNKFSVSDKVTTLRCLLQLSCIPKEERDYRKLLKGGEVDTVAFQAFCEKHPQLIRRMRETLIRYGRDEQGEDLIMYLAVKPRDVVDFLRDNEVLPNRFNEINPRVLETNRLKQFPVLPPAFYTGEAEELNPNRPIGDGEASALRAARAWFRYANEVVPENPKDSQEVGIPGFSPVNYRDPERKRRMPRRPMLIIFRQGPARAQTYVAEQLSKEGWIDRSPWNVDEFVDVGQRWFKNQIEIKPTANAQEEWERAYKKWWDHGRDTGLNLTTAELHAYQRRAELYANKYGFRVGERLEPLRPSDQRDPALKDSYEANTALIARARNLHVTNYESFLHQADAEKDPLMARARKLLFEAERAYRNPITRSESVDKYLQVLGTQEKMGLWGELLLKHFRTRSPLQKDGLLQTASSGQKEKILEETYEYQIRFMRLIRDYNRPKLQLANLTLFDILRAGSPGGAASAYHLATCDRLLQTLNLPALNAVDPFFPPGPFDGVDPDNNLWVPDVVKMQVRMNMGLIKSQPMPSGPRGALPKRPGVGPG
jgi:hypothetical protein